MRRVVIACASVLLAGSIGCGDDTGGAGSSGAGGGGTGGGDASTTAASGTTSGGSADGCGAKVTIGFFSDDACTVATGQRVYDTGLECFSWTAMGSNAEDNSATRFQCYADRICYTQHPSTLTCTDSSPGPTDKEAKVGECIKEPSGQLYSMVLSGTDGCPAAPAGFECPASAAGEGTAEIAACSSAP